LSAATTGAEDKRLQQKAAFISNVKNPENPRPRSDFARAAATAVRLRRDGLKQRISSAIEIVCIYNRLAEGH
jgi:hypothetical protein